MQILFLSPLILLLGASLIHIFVLIKQSNIRYKYLVLINYLISDLFFSAYIIREIYLYLSKAN